MPTYEYRCKDCDHQFDIQQSFTDDALTACPECGGVLKKVFGNVGITFKGSGFYKTDSRSGSGGASSPSSSDKGSSSSEKGSSSSDKGADTSSSTSGAKSDASGSGSTGSGSSTPAPATTSS